MTSSVRLLTSTAPSRHATSVIRHAGDDTEPTLTTPPHRPDELERLPAWAWGGGLFAFVAFGAELAASLFGRAGEAGPFSWLAPVGWPNPVRFVWWAAAAAGIVALHVGRRRSGERPSALMTAATASLFLVFGIGVLFSAEWATWH